MFYSANAHSKPEIESKLGRLTEIEEVIEREREDTNDIIQHINIYKYTKCVLARVALHRVYKIYI